MYVFNSVDTHCTYFILNSRACVCKLQECVQSTSRASKTSKKENQKNSVEMRCCLFKKNAANVFFTIAILSAAINFIMLALRINTLQSEDSAKFTAYGCLLCLTLFLVEMRMKV